MASPQAGTYHVVCAAKSGSVWYALEPLDHGVANGKNLMTYAITDANGRQFTIPTQAWTVSYRSDGAAQLANRPSGKVIDVWGTAYTDGNGMQIWENVSAADQFYAIESTGSTSTYLGQTYPTYTIRPWAGQTVSLAPEGNAAGNKQARLYNNSSATAQQWMFVPIPPFSSGGMYEVRSMLRFDAGLDLASGSADTNGANIQLYAANGGNNQKFSFTEVEGRWRIVSVRSGKLLGVQGNLARNGQNVRQWSDTGEECQWWKVTSEGTTTIEGTECEVVTLGNYVTSDGSTYFMDVQNALTSNSANIDIQQAATGTNMAKQRWALLPTSPRGTTVPAPASLGWCEAAGDAARSLTLPEAERLYPAWTCTEAWAADGAEHYEWRWRTQSMAGATGEWGAWSDWTAWEVADAIVDGTSVWSAKGLPAQVPTSDRALQYQLEVRAATFDGEEVLVGPVASATLRAVTKATVAVSGLSFGPEGLGIAYASDYSGGTNVVQVTGVYVGGTNLLSTARTYTGLRSEGTVTVPVDALSAWIADGASVTVRFRNGTDMLAVGSDVTSYTGTVSYDTGTATATATLGAGRTVEVSLTGGTATKAWIVRDGQVSEVSVTGGVAHVLAPFGDTASYEVFLSYSGGVAHVGSSQMATLLANLRPCHAWNWDGGSFLLEVREGEPLVTEYSVDRNYDTFQLNSREWEAVHYQVTKTGAFEAVGALSDLMELESTREDLFALCDRGHVTYRSPSGLVADVAVEGFRTAEWSTWTEVSVSMKRVTN